MRMYFHYSREINETEAQWLRNGLTIQPLGNCRPPEFFTVATDGIAAVGEGALLISQAELRPTANLGFHYELQPVTSYSHRWVISFSPPLFSGSAKPYNVAVVMKAFFQQFYPDSGSFQMPWTNADPLHISAGVVGATGLRSGQQDLLTLAHNVNEEVGGFDRIKVLLGTDAVRILVNNMSEEAADEFLSTNYNLLHGAGWYAMRRAMVIALAQAGAPVEESALSDVHPELVRVWREYQSPTAAQPA